MDEKTIKEFDKTLLDTASKEIYIDKLLCKIFAGIALIMTACVCDDAVESPAAAAAVSICLTAFLAAKVYWDNMRYLYVKSGRPGVSVVHTSIYYVLRLVPCDKSAFIRNRLKRFTRSHGIFILLSVAVKLFQQFVFGFVSPIVYLSLAFIWLSSFVYGVLIIYQSVSWKWDKQG
ncbi:MAG: hypothetical protein E7241_08445 [Lachnospiraceae bacterium]|nr:hypothetical protein [Lachnospiraceae bacterium]